MLPERCNRGRTPSVLRELNAGACIHTVFCPAGRSGDAIGVFLQPLRPVGRSPWPLLPRYSELQVRIPDEAQRNCCSFNEHAKGFHVKTPGIVLRVTKRQR